MRWESWLFGYRDFRPKPTWCVQEKFINVGAIGHHGARDAIGEKAEEVGKNPNMEAFVT